MTSAREVEVTCPCCGAAFNAPELMSTNTFGGRTTDLHAKAVGFDPIVFMVGTCPQCGYTDYSHNLIKGDITLTDDLKRRVFDELTPHLPVEQRINPALCYEFLAKIAQWRGTDPLKIGDLYLRAAWCCQDYGQQQGEHSNRLAAIAYYKRWLDHTPLRDEEYFVITYLVGELYRRVGNADSAREWFDRVLDGVGAEAGEKLQRIAELARQQRDDPKEML